jgi:hypothetical protein
MPPLAVCFSKFVHWLPVPDDVVPELDEPPSRRPLALIFPVKDERVVSRNRPGLKDPVADVLSSCPNEPAPGALVFAPAIVFRPGN